MERSGQNKRIEKSCRVLGKELFLSALYLDRGVLITITGGDKSHIGAVTVADETGVCSTICLPGHRENVITEQWAPVLYERLKEPVSITAGIHYDHVSKEEIGLILKAVGEMLEEICHL